MKIGILGAGNIGGTLTRRLREIGHDVSVANSRSPETLHDLATETGARAVWAKDIAAGANLVIVTIPEKDVPSVPAGFLQGAAPNVVVVDTGNYYPQQRDGLISAIEDGMAESVWVQSQLGVSVIKCFNGIEATHLLERGTDRASEGRIALPVAGDDGDAKAVVMALVDELGFDAVDAGTLEESWRQQPGSPVYGADLDAPGVRDALSRAVSERTGAWKA